MKVFSLNPPTDPNDDYYYGSNGKSIQHHVKWWAFGAIPVHAIFFGLAIAKLAGLYGKNDSSVTYNLTVNPIAILIWCLLLIGSRKSIWILYIPVLVYLFIATILTSFLTGVKFERLFSVASMNLKQYGEYLKEYQIVSDRERPMEITLLVLSIFFCFFVVTLLWYLICGIVRACQHAYFLRKSGVKEGV